MNKFFSILFIYFSFIGNVFAQEKPIYWLNPAIAIANQTPITNLIVSETFTAGDFPVKILELTGSSPYSGKGFIVVPYLADTKIAVEFNNITVNTNYQLINGVVQTTYNPSWNNVTNTTNSNASNSSNSTEQTVNFPIASSDNIQVNTQQGTITIIGTNGQSIAVNINSQYETTTIIDSNGVGYVVNNSTGAVTTSSQLQEVVTSVEQNQATIKFKIKETTFLHKEDFATMVHGKDIDIEILKKDASSTIDLSKLQFKLENNVVNATKVGEKYFVKIKADANTLKSRKNTLKVLDVDGRDLAKLYIITYKAPIVKFEKNSNYAGDYLFDEGFKTHDVLKSATYYPRNLTLGRNNEIYYAPVIGLNRTQSVNIKVNVQDFEDIAKKDPDFKLVFRPTVENKIQINNLAVLEVNAENLKNMNALNIIALNYINNRELESINIEVFVKETNERVGLIEYFCAQPVNKTIQLIYTKFLGEPSFPSPYNNNQLQNYLNTNSHNQFFIEYLVQSENFEVNQDRISFLTNKNNANTIFYGLKAKRFPAVFGADNVPSYTHSLDYYFITDLEIIKTTTDEGTAGSYLGAAHLRGENGGVHLKTTSPIGETQEELDAHEFGHWIGLPHTFEEKNQAGTIIQKPNPFITIHTNQAGSRDNFMDYNIKRKSWFRLQLLNTNRTSNP